MRINKFIAHAGICSRRKADDLIKEKRVRVNGKLVEDFSLKVSKDDKIEVDGKTIEIEDKFYYKLNKPVGYISSNYDPHNENDLEKLVKLDRRFFCAGRLDMDSHGLMLITNDGDLVNRLIHPRFEVKKEYIVKVDRPLSKKQEEDFLKPIDLGDNEVARGQDLKALAKDTYRVIIHQGYNRQIRRMFAHFSSQVIDLKRVRIGEIKLGDLKEASYKALDDKEMEFLKKV